ncbi:MAG: hypothetical protein H6555_01715 [Lewinellaceae bacterium]|nr:hypothetical protein [Lewinellaceae bacterium]
MTPVFYRVSQLFVFVMGSLLFLTSCQSLEKIPINEEERLVEYSRGACFGPCPVYTFVVYTSGIATFTGERYTNRQGLYIRKLSTTEMDKVKEQLTAANIWQYPPIFRSNLPDLPTITITQYEDRVSKSVTGKESLPAEVQQLRDGLEQLANTGEWTLRRAPDYGLPPGVTPNELIIQLRPGVFADSWSLQYVRQGLRLIRSFPAENNLWLFSYDLNLASPQEMQQMLRYDQQVLKYEFNPKQDKKGNKP